MVPPSIPDTEQPAGASPFPEDLSHTQGNRQAASPAAAEVAHMTCHRAALGEPTPPGDRRTPQVHASCGRNGPNPQTSGLESSAQIEVLEAMTIALIETLTGPD